MRVVIADDAVLLREGLVRLLDRERATTWWPRSATARRWSRRSRSTRPDVSIVDVRMPPSHTDEGLRAAVEARGPVPGTPVLVLSQYVEVSYADDLLGRPAAAAVGYLLKDRVADDRRVPRRAGAGGRRRHRARPGGGGPVARPAPARRPAARR